VPGRLPIDMLKELMDTYGPETIVPMKRRKINASDAPANIRRKFAQYFPNLEWYFYYDPWIGKLVPILGEAKEKERRRLSRQIHSERYRLRGRKKRSPKTRK